ncbi:twin-arginine translocase TatA/TatE family subunit [Faecalibacterium prausnitzii]|uniref:twin-arginine translocase TatA/TatE family subunit n=1 Tax=Faecalibacterium prausnitzii TaxID=853 RepID=UPI00290AEFFC|nr:twin-arginine translocase TatA/TatE family subunit [Faecalibacterium prausnitzii]
MRIGTNELLIILVVALLIFGPKNLPKLGKMFGKTINGFKKGMDEDANDDDDAEEKTEKKASKKKDEDEE